MALKLHIALLESRLRADLYPTEENTDMNLNVKSLRAFALATVIGSTTALAQEAATPSPQSKMMQGKMAGMGDQHAKMMAMHEKMMADKKAMDAKMDQKVAAMNAAQGTAKTDAMASVINEMVAQHKQMTTHMDSMHKEMMDKMGHPDAPMKGMGMGKMPKGSQK